MKKIGFATLVLLLCKTLSIAQFPFRYCDSLVLDTHTQDVLNIKEKTFREYLLNHKKLPSHLLSNRKNLRLLKTWICAEEEVLIVDTIKQQFIHVYLKKGQKNFDSSPYVWPNSTNQSMLLYDGDKSPYGFLAMDTLVDYIEELQITLVNDRSFHIPSEFFNDLYFPNFCDTYLSLKPMQVFLSPDQDKIFLYIFGKIRERDLVGIDQAFSNSYMAKIIIDLKTGYHSRIVLRGEELRYYNWNNCIDFIGF